MNRRSAIGKVQASGAQISAAKAEVERLEQEAGEAAAACDLRILSSGANAPMLLRPTLDETGSLDLAMYFSGRIPAPPLGESLRERQPDLVLNMEAMRQIRDYLNDLLEDPADAK